MGSMVPPSVMNISKNLKNSQNIYFFMKVLFLDLIVSQHLFIFLYVTKYVCFFLFLPLKLGFVIKCNR